MKLSRGKRMLRLMLMRHAKSDRPPGIADADRGLNARGRATATAMGRYIASELEIPGLILCSTASRTQETCERVVAAFPEPPAVQLEERLYLASDHTITAMIGKARADRRSLLVIGHNPGIHDAAQNLVSTGDAKERACLREKFPTAALAVIDFDVPLWADIIARGGRLVQFITPRDLVRTD
jgi:phosphohistidine phosphatase